MHTYLHIRTKYTRNVYSNSDIFAFFLIIFLRLLCKLLLWFSIVPRCIVVGTIIVIISLLLFFFSSFILVVAVLVVFLQQTTSWLVGCFCLRFKVTALERCELASGKNMICTWILVSQTNPAPATTTPSRCLSSF